MVNTVKSGIYKIQNTKNKKYYIGSSNNLIRRFREHKRLLNKNNHPNKHLQNAWNKYGKESFEFSCLKECKKEKLITFEQNFLDTLEPKYNNRKIATIVSSPNWSEEAKEKQRQRMKGNSYALGHRHSEETRKLISEKAVGHPNYNTFVTKETKKKQSIAQLKRNQRDGKEYVMVSPDKKVTYFKSANAFAQQNNFTRVGIKDCCTGRQKTHRKHKFYYLENYNGN